ncbi:sulfate transporter permease CysW [Salmonella enterica subsp. enterica]|uniref:Sulfate transporter permease CysW n=1 Tax=Salmonella enterica I TaxID=59201 RepID=A0A379WR60_SALET|nr:sulfate transporter permease CysW [Salmonella enterica subsp. enterica]
MVSDWRRDAGLGVILLVPMIYIFVQAFSKGLMPVLQNLADPDMLHAIWLTVLIALIAVPVNLVFGILLAWLVTRFNFPGRQLLLTLLDIPFAVSPVWPVWFICCFMVPTARWALAG